MRCRNRHCTRRACSVAGVLAVVSAALVWIPGGCERTAGGGGSANAGKSAAPASVPLDLRGAVVIGASVSAGAEVTLPGLKPKMLRGDATLADVLAAIAPAGGPTGLADMMFFARPDKVAESQLAAALGKQPRIVFAVDYLFWHAYGAPMNSDQRRSMFEKGLARLDQFTCPIIVADLPDMSHAVGMMLMAPQVPPRALQDELNRKLEAWAAERPRVVLLRLRDVVAKAMMNQPVELGGQSLDGDHARGLLTPSGLHTTAEGAILLALECLRQLKDRGLIEATSTWATNVAEIKARLTESKLAEERAADAVPRRGKD